MDEINHGERAHAKRGPSNSAQWIFCPGSMNACEQYPEDDETSEFAAEGTLAHEVADLCLSNNRMAEYYEGKEVDGVVIEIEMVRYVQEYLDYVRSFETPRTVLLCEDKVDFSDYVPGGFGTMDSGVINYQTKTLDVIDLKYGKGISVSAYKNTQGLLYGVGIVSELTALGMLDGIETIRIHIFQPRIPNISHFEVTINELLWFAIWAGCRAEDSKDPDAPRIPGDKQCQWCDHKANCIELQELTEKIIGAEFDDLTEDKEMFGEVSLPDPDNLTDEQRKMILDHSELVTKFLKAVAGSAFAQIENGGEFPGYKIVRGTSRRTYTDEGAAKLIRKLGVKKAHNYKIIGVGEAEKLTSKKYVDGITHKPEGKLTLAIEHDKRAAVDFTPVGDEFDDLDKVFIFSDLPNEVRGIAQQTAGEFAEKNDIEIALTEAYYTESGEFIDIIEEYENNKAAE